MRRKQHRTFFDSAGPFNFESFLEEFSPFFKALFARKRLKKKPRVAIPTMAANKTS